MSTAGDDSAGGGAGDDGGDNRGNSISKGPVVGGNSVCLKT